MVIFSFLESYFQLRGFVEVLKNQGKKVFARKQVEPFQANVPYSLKTSENHEWNRLEIFLKVKSLMIISPSTGYRNKHLKSKSNSFTYNQKYYRRE